jgi:hypothetical protein
MAVRSATSGRFNVSRNQRVIGGIVLVVLVAAGGIAYAVTGGSSTNSQGPVIIFSKVQTRTLQDTVALNGTLARKQIRNVTAATQGIVSAVNSTNGSTTNAGDVMFAINGRDAVAEQGTVPFFRSLAPGDQGEDVLQLKQILAASGDYPGPINNLYTEQTQFALAQWQAQHHYPNSTPATPQSVTVALTQGSGYKLGAGDSAGLTIGPPPAQTSRSSSGGEVHGTLTAFRPAVAPRTTTPVLTIQSVDDDVAQGAPATFVISASSAPTTDTTVNLTSGGTAGSGDIVTPPTSVVLPTGMTSVSVQVQTRVNTTVEQAPTVVLSLASGTGYTVGDPSSAQTTIKNSNVPTLQITGGTTVSPGGSATLTITADQAPLVDTQVALSIGGSAVAGTDYDPVQPVVTLSAGTTSATVTFNTLNTNVIQSGKYIVVALTASPSTYSVGTQGSTVITIGGSGALPTVTLSSPTTYLQKGQPYDVTVSLSEAVSTPLTIDLKYGGTAAQGTDYTVPGGSIVVPAGQTSTVVAIPTVTNNVVESDRVLTVSLSSSASYTTGTPNTLSVTITSSVLPTLNITSNMSTVSQGGAATFTITADQAPVMNTSVNFTVQGTAVPGQNYVPLVGTALLQAGHTQVTVVLQSLETNVTFEPTDMIVGQWPIRVGQVFVKAGATVAPGEAMLSLTESDLTVTLQASAADRSKLALGQHCTVQIAGETNEGTGTITELDATPTVISSGGAGGSSQVYEGKIEVSDLTGADGSQVSINVVDQQVNDALTVPIAAVKQNGSGVDVVRVIDLAKGGSVTEVPVTTGLTEGSYIQITKGLQLGELVIAGADQSQ